MVVLFSGTTSSALHFMHAVSLFARMTTPLPSQRACLQARTNSPGRAPVSSPFSNMGWPATIVDV